MRGTTLINLRRLVVSRMAGREPEKGVAMMTAILFMIIVAGVSSIILGVVTTQVTPSYTAQKGTKTIYSAQAGIQAALSIMRTATSYQTVNGVSSLYGDITKLPCTISVAPTNGVTDGNLYTVTIGYYTADPTSHASDPTWLSTYNLCPSPTALHPTSTPKFALITSVGTATQIPIASTAANRSITAVYQFKLSNVNIPGGLINNNGVTACLQAASINAGATIGWVASAQCGQTSANSSLQLWSYTKTWQIALSSTQTGGAAGVCISGYVPSVPAGQTTATATLQPCATDSSRWDQLWSWIGSYTWVGELQDISGPNTNPKDPSKPTPTQVIGAYLSPGVADGTSPIGHNLQVSTTVTGTLAPTSLVGAGGAQYSTHQLVNYQEFGRCTDVTNERIDYAYMIDYPCKQDPTGGTTYITWNQKYYYCEASDTSSACAGVNVAAQQIYVYYQDNVAQKYCFTAPSATTSTSSGPVYYPYFTACATSGPLVALQTWSRIYNTGTFSSSYLVINTGLRPDLGGLCLEANNSSGTTFSSSPVISELTLAQCNGSPLQQWNAVPTYVGGTVGGYREISGG
jgi:hypothetical protein